MEEKLAELEALLFIHGEPLELKKIQNILGIDTEGVRSLVISFEERLQASDRGLFLLRDDEKVQIVTKPQFASIIQNFVKEELSEDLTPASLETLSLISYLGPLSRSRLDYLRGVNSTFILRSLMLRGLVERFSDPEHPSGFLYRASFELLRHLGVKNQNELPEREKFVALLREFESGAMAEARNSGETTLPPASS